MTTQAGLETSRASYYQIAIQTNQPKISNENGAPIEEKSDYGSALYLAQQTEVPRKLLEERYPQSLSTELHKGISEEHTKARKNEFLNSLIQGGMTFCSKAYVVYLCNLFVIHEAIEKAQQKIIEKQGQDYFVFPVLFRSERLLNDIKIWSIFNTLAPKFAPKDILPVEFVNNVRELTEKRTHEFVSHIEKMAEEDPLLTVGSLYALYGTVMSGGQFVKEGRNGKEGVKSGFICRIEEIDDDEKMPLKDDMREMIKQNPSCMQTLAEESVSFFSFPENFSISLFKKEWHKNLDELREKLGLQGKRERKF